MDYLLAAVLLLAVGIGLFWLSRPSKRPPNRRGKGRPY
jgi:hypothetical protein